MDVYGHRGAGGEAPENTIAGCRHAIERGVRFIEFDVRLSKDDKLVVIHDKTVDRTTSDRGKVRRFKAAELGKMDARSDAPPWRLKRHTGVPTLEKLIDATPEIKRYQLEVKGDSKSTIKRVAALLAERFPDRESASRFVVTSSDYNLHTFLYKSAPHIRRGMIPMKLNAYTVAMDLECVYYCMHWSGCSPLFVRELHAKGCHVSAWTVNDETAIKNLYRMKIDSVITDYPSMALPLVGKLSKKK